MLKIESVTIKNKGNYTIENLTCHLPNQSIVLLKNNVKLNHFVTSLVGKRSIENGEIYIDKHFTEDNQIDRFPFYVITKDVVNFWANFKLREITKLISKSKCVSYESEKISSSQYFSDLSPVQKLKYFIDIGKSINRKIFILESPLERLDYEDMEEFKKFMLHELFNDNYIIIDRKINDVYKILEVPIYYF